MNFLRLYRQGLRVGLEDFKLFWNWWTWLGAWMLRITCNAAIWMLLGKLLGSRERLEFLLIGNAVLAGATGSSLAVASSVWDRWDGTYPLLVVAPSSLFPVTFGRTSVWLFNGIGSSLAAFIILTTAFGLTLPLPAAFSLPIAVTVISTSSYCFMLFLGALVTRAPRFRNVLSNIAWTGLAAVCGVSVPVEFWPRPVQLLAELLPLTHGLRATRIMLAQAPDTLAIVQGFALELLVASGWLGLTLLTIDRFANAGRADGSIEFV